jgi:hypothetical protein
MGSIGAPRFGFGRAPAISFTSDDRRLRLLREATSSFALPHSWVDSFKIIGALPVFDFCGCLRSTPDSLIDPSLPTNFRSDLNLKTA